MLLAYPLAACTPCQLRAAAGRWYRRALPVAAVTVGGCALSVVCSARVSLAHALHACFRSHSYAHLGSNRYAAVRSAVTAMQPLLLCSDCYAAVARVAAATFLQQLRHHSRAAAVVARHLLRVVYAVP